MLPGYRASRAGGGGSLSRSSWRAMRQSLHEALSRARIGILLVTARPYERDVAYRNLSRQLVDLIHERGLPAEVKVLRPPTFEQLRAELQARGLPYRALRPLSLEFASQAKIAEPAQTPDPSFLR